MQTDNEIKRTSFGSFTESWASINFFRHFTIKKTILPLPAEVPSCLCIQWRHVRRVCLFVSFARKFVYQREMKGSETF